MLEPAAAVVVLASGVYLTSVASFWSVGWVQVAVAFWLVNSAVAAAIVKPALSRVAAQAAAAADGPIGQHLDALRRSLRWTFGGALLHANDAAMLYLMAIKPALAGSLLVVAGTNLVVTAARSIGHAFRRADVAHGCAAALAIACR